MTRARRIAGISTLAVAAILLAGCSSSDDSATPLPGPPTSQTPSTTAPSAAPNCNAETALESYRPDANLPQPGQMPAGSTMRKIQDRGRLIAGVSADTYLLGSRNPISGQIEGFDIDMVKAMAKAIFGDENKYELKVITAADRIPALVDGRVDMVARNMTINCDRWSQIAFSAEYYHSGQKILVPLGAAKDTSIDDLAGERVCAPAGSTSLAKLDDYPDVKAVSATTHTGCLVMFQSGDVDAITGDDTVLAGLAAQDPYAFVPPNQRFLSEEPYGLGFNQSSVDLVRFANGVLAQIEQNGQWAASYNRWLGVAFGTKQAPAPPTPEYGR